jgi:hypothetical protein
MEKPLLKRKRNFILTNSLCLSNLSIFHLVRICLELLHLGLAGMHILILIDGYWMNLAVHNILMSFFSISSVLLPSACSKPPISSTGCSSPQHNSQSPMETDASLSYPKTHSAEMILGNGPSNCQEEDSSCAAGVKVVSPNKKRVSPRQIGTGLTNRSGRELILEFTPLFPSLSGDVNSEPH